MGIMSQSFKRFKSLHHQVVLTLLILLTGTVVVLSVLFYVISSSIVIRDGHDQTTQSVQDAGDYIGLYFDHISSISEGIGDHLDTIDILQNPDSTRLKALGHMMATFKKNDSRIKTIALVSKGGKVLYAGDKMLMETTSDMMSKSWYQEALHADQMPKLMSARRSEFSMNKDEWVISVSREIVSNKGEHLGVLLIDIDYKAIEDYLQKLELGRLGYSFIIAQDGQVVYHPDSSYYTDQDKSSELVTICEKGSGYKSKSGLIAFKTEVAHTDWILVGLSSLDNVTLLQKQLFKAMAMAMLIILLPGVLIGYRMSLRMTKPLNLLQSAMKSLDAQLTPFVTSESSAIEIIELTNHYNAMLSTIRRLMEDVKGNERKLRELELTALQGQINPHFLYNTLETIIWLTEFGDGSKVVGVTKSLSEMLRYGLRKDNGITTLEDELKHVKHYLLIQKERYLDELEYEINNQNVDLGYRIPKLILQPIVENAIYHGIRPKGGGMVRIELRRMENLYIDITDDGVGFEYKNEAEDRLKLGGVGLINVDQRIKLLCGEDYGVIIETRSDENGIISGTRVRLKLPFDVKH